MAVHHFPYSIRLCPKRTDYSDAAAIALADESFDLLDNRLRFRLVHRPAANRTNGRAVNVHPANSGLIKTWATQSVVVGGDPETASVERLVRELDDVRV